MFNDIKILNMNICITDLYINLLNSYVTDILMKYITCINEFVKKTSDYIHSLASFFVTLRFFFIKNLSS